MTYADETCEFFTTSARAAATARKDEGSSVFAYELNMMSQSGTTLADVIEAIEDEGWSLESHCCADMTWIGIFRAE